MSVKPRRVALEVQEKTRQAVSPLWSSNERGCQGWTTNFKWHLSAKKESSIG